MIVKHGPERWKTELIPPSEAVQPQPEMPARGLTMQDPDPYWLHHAAIQGSVAAHRNAALLMPAFRGG